MVLEADIWADLKEKIRKLSGFRFKARSQQKTYETGWNGEGEGRIWVENVGDQCIYTHEKGQYYSSDGKSLNIENIYCWEFAKTSIILSHMRYGAPVKLFDLIEASSGEMASMSIHLCGSDAYSARLYFRQEGFDLEWHIQGSRKNEKLFYYYF